MKQRERKKRRQNRRRGMSVWMDGESGRKKEKVEMGKLNQATRG